MPRRMVRKPTARMAQLQMATNTVRQLFVDVCLVRCSGSLNDVAVN